MGPKTEDEAQVLSTNNNGFFSRLCVVGTRRVLVCVGLAASLLSAPAGLGYYGQDGAKPESPEEIMRRLREEARKAGIDVDKLADPTAQPAPAPAMPAPAQPAPVQPAQPAPAQPPKAQPAPTPAAGPTGTGNGGNAGAGKPGAMAPAAGGVGMPGAMGAGGMPADGEPRRVAGPFALPPGYQGNPDEAFTFNFVDSVELLSLVEFVRDALGLQIIATDGGLKGQTVTLTAPVTVRQDQVLPFIVTLLEEKEYTLTQDFPGVYVVKPKNALTPAFGSTTRVFQTPNIRPTSLQQAIQTIVNTNRGQTPPSQPVFMDDLGVFIITDTPRMLSLVQQLIDTLVAERAQVKFFKFDLVNIAAVNAKDRVLELLGQQGQRLGGAAPGQPGQPIQAAPVPGGGTQITNIGERMTVDPTANALFFRGRQDERDLLGELLTLVDTPNTMIARWYPVGLSTAEAVANAGVGQQLGNVSSFETSSGRGGGGRGGLVGQPGIGGAGGQGQSQFSGTGFTIFPENGGFIYRGTEPQHARVAALVDQLKDLSERDAVVLEFYKLKHGKATDIAEVIQNLITNSSPVGNRGGGLLARESSAGRSRDPRRPNQPASPNQQAQQAAAGADGALGDLGGEDVFVIADEPNNQVVVKAPRKLQPQFRQLINRIDLRRPQVYIDAKIVAVSSSDDFRLAVEAQQIIGQFALNTNFGLGSLPANPTTVTGDTPQGIQSRKSVATGLGGLTSALIRSKDVPLIINALARDIDTRIVATPQLLVDDNEEASVSSVDQQPTSTTSQSGQAGSTITSFGGFEEAGPKLTVKPQISEGGYLRLEYTIELSSFQGSASGNLPPPKQENKIESKSVTVPSDATIVIGGLTFEQNGRTVVKVPLLGDIPLIGQLFRDESTSKRSTTLYVFITPKIMRDPSFADLRLITRAPLAQVRLDGEYPPPEAEAIPLVKGFEWQKRDREREEADRTRPNEPSSPAGKEPEATTPVRRRAWDRRGDPG